METAIEQESSNMDKERSNHEKNIEDLHIKHEEEINAEKENIKVHFEKLTETFQQKEL